jgi:UDP-N-acetylglucosamine 2-epimerase
MIKIVTIVGTRPEIIKLSRVISELEKHTEHVLVHTGQNYAYELNEIFFNEMGIKKPDYFLDAVGGSAAETIGNIISKSDKVLEEVCPDAVLLYGDTNSCLSVISAKKRKIPIFHMEAGNRCFDQRVPEEINRKIVDHLSDINMTLTEHARRYLLREGLAPETIIKTGSSMKEVLHFHKEEIAQSEVLARLGLANKNYFVVSAHREENVDNEENFRNLMNCLESIYSNYKMPIIVSTHPRTQNKIEELGMENTKGDIQFMKPLGFFDYISLQKNAFCVVSDSGTITEEASILKFPAVTIRQVHERPEGMDEGTIMMTGLKKEYVLEAIKIVTTHDQDESVEFNIVGDYDVDNVSKKVLRIIISYIDYVNRTVWHQ